MAPATHAGDRVLNEALGIKPWVCDLKAGQGAASMADTVLDASSFELHSPKKFLCVRVPRPQFAGAFLWLGRFEIATIDQHGTVREY